MELVLNERYQITNVDIRGKMGAINKSLTTSPMCAGMSKITCKWGKGLKFQYHDAHVYSKSQLEKMIREFSKIMESKLGHSHVFWVDFNVKQTYIAMSEDQLDEVLGWEEGFTLVAPAH